MLRGLSKGLSGSSMSDLDFHSFDYTGVCGSLRLGGRYVELWCSDVSFAFQQHLRK